MLSRESRFWGGGSRRGWNKFRVSRSFPDHQQSFPIKRWKSTRHRSQEGRHRCLSSELTSFAPKATIRAVTPVKWRIHQKCRPPPPRLDVSLDVRLAGSLLSHSRRFNWTTWLHWWFWNVILIHRDNSMKRNGEIAIIYRRRNIVSQVIWNSIVNTDINTYIGTLFLKKGKFH